MDSHYEESQGTAAAQYNAEWFWYTPITTCPYLGICSDVNSWLCHSCRNNTSKKSYYEPEDRPIYRRKYPRWLNEPEGGFDYIIFM